jgi:FkbM family methyltransferase
MNIGKLRTLVAENTKAMMLTARYLASTHGFVLKYDGSTFLLIQQNKAIRVSLSNLHYIKDLLKDFNFYFESVSPADQLPNGCLTSDFSEPRFHVLTGWEHFPVHFPSLPEPLLTSTQYSELLALSAGETILDLGSYAGVSAMYFKKEVGTSGRVISVEPDEINLLSSNINFQNFLKYFGSAPELINNAVWNKNEKLQFTVEGNMGSGATEIIGRSRTTRTVSGITLSEISHSLNVPRVDAIKADIEGSEAKAFEDADFFRRHNPRIIFEADLRGNKKSLYSPAVGHLESYGYTCEVFPQIGSRQFLVRAIRGNFEFQKA